jgi:hypothetical protein
MVLYQPPAGFDGTVNRYVLRRGSCLWRVHHHPDYDAWAFNPEPSSELYGGSRFDATEADRYPFLYAGLSEETALAETLLRDIAPDERGFRTVPSTATSRRRMAALVLIADLRLISLVNGPDLAAIGQDSWLVTAPGQQYPQTRDWAHWLRRQAPWAHGLVWDSLRDRGSLALVLFGDRLARDFGADYEKALLREVPELAVHLGDEDGRAWVNERLRLYRAVVAPPPPTG